MSGKQNVYDRQGYPPMPSDQPYYQAPPDRFGYGVEQRGGQYTGQAFQPVPDVGSAAGFGPVAGIPLYAEPNQRIQKFVVQGYKDIWASVLFILCFFTCFVIGCVSFKQQLNAHPVDMHKEVLLNLNGAQLFGALLGMVGLSSVLAVVSLALFFAFPQKAIIGANVMNIVLLIVVSIASFSKGVVFAGVLLLFAAVLNALMLYFWRERIPFSALLLKVSTHIVSRYKSMIAASFVLVAVFCLYLVFWSAMMYPPLTRINKHAGTGSDVALILFGLLCFYWISQVVVNVMHVTASGVTATWYFVGGGEMPRNPTLSSLKRASTTSFGSICFGSLLVAILSLLRFLASSQRDSDQAVIACIVECIIACIERLVEYFNHYAFVYCAIYGYGYIDAAKRTFELAKNCAFEATFNDSLVGTTLGMTALGMSCLCFGIFWGAFQSIALGLLALAVSFFVHIQVFRSIDSAVTTIFVCFAEEPSTLAETNAELYDALYTANAGIAP